MSLRILSDASEAAAVAFEDARDAARDEERPAPVQLVLAPCRGDDGTVAWAPRPEAPPVRLELTEQQRIDRDWRDFTRAWFGGAV